MCKEEDYFENKSLLGKDDWMLLREGNFCEGEKNIVLRNIEFDSVRR